MSNYPVYLKKKYSSSTQTEALFMISGVLAQIIFTKYYYDKNIDLKNFTSEILKRNYKEYLFSNRNTLYARVLRDIYKEDEEKQLETINRILAFIYRETDKDLGIRTKKNNESTKNQKSNIKSWSEIINPKS
ncbi:hypothetical protein [Enterococcus faecium]|uniref:hypothetical protein n=1 Tax=Enterococcus faecium TaxID=1352 RepID=UPI001A04A148|nr:hypothetical protein [Enterococcus faecium]EGP4907480.1 hypothetical protein [Enterococcus faecium]